LKIFDFRNLNVGAEHNVLEIFDDFEIAEAFEDDDVKQTIINDSVFKKREGPSVKAAISNENKRSFFQEVCSDSMNSFGGCRAAMCAAEMR
jgi:hypothetical protein